MEISWKRNFYTLWCAELFAIIGFHAVQPFLAYYIQEFDVENLEEALLWSGYMGSVAGFSMALSAPIWGAVADRFGRKSMVVRSMVGGGLTVFFMAYADSVTELLVARMLQGALAGTVTACITMVSTTTPKQHLGYAMGMMQGAFLLGAALGPLAGGPFIEAYGYQAIFLVSVVMVVVAGLAVQLLVREEFNNNKPEVENASASKSNTDDFIADTKRLLQLKPFLVTIISLVLIQFAYGVIMPVVPLFLQQLAGHAEIITEAGFIFSLASLTGALSSAVLGGWTERIGVKRMLFVGLVTTALFLACQGSAESVMVFAALQVMGGLTTGAVRPVANTITTFVVAEEDRGKAFGIMTSASALGWAMGPSMGGYIGSTTGFRSVFYATALLFLGVAFWTRWAMRGLVLQGEIVRQRRVGQSFRERVRSLRGS
ncbi:MAG: MFS transporter [Candidatus Latescibacterota bacterium]|nr:MFS transporter [Candidatus Latescibacterota bacterium]